RGGGVLHARHSSGVGRLAPAALTELTSAGAPGMLGPRVHALHSEGAVLMVRTRRRLVPALGALTLAAGLGLVGAGPALAGGPGQGQGPGSGGGPGECRLAGSTLTFTGAPEPDLTETFTTYADTAGEWTGADSTYSIPLKGNTILWVFSDTFLGEVAEDGSRPLDSPFLNNSFVMQDRRGELSTITGPDDTS